MFTFHYGEAYQVFYNNIVTDKSASFVESFIVMLASIIPNFEENVAPIKKMGKSGFVLAVNLTVRGPNFWYTTYPKQWQAKYQRRNYFALDPIFMWSVTNEGVKRWSEIPLPDMRGILKEANLDFGMKYGVVISRKIQYKRSFVAAARADRDFTDGEIAALNQAFEKILNEVAADPKLSAGEIQVLRCLRDGMGQREIAQTIGISESAVKQRCGKALHKLGAKTRTQAVAISVGKQLL
ncbi:LuxR family transcriptional regulator [Amylibacter ulvae]|uniref:LuxR family transcriptional regulator n=1 Tax=Paramylibacter ulvae TaxID=1651968 RepID=A0ABQ3CXZ0_9RHOB|nr:LuxR family transcriptional regulator [Amylibacter ulvae]GHA48682.1 LuxR family transcriptional regulator [Amylibacter ulvae]